jgi:hypothetical protein
MYRSTYARRGIATVLALAATIAVASPGSAATLTAPRSAGASAASAAADSRIAAAGWHHLWGPAAAWTSGGPYNTWRSNTFGSRGSLGINFRCWWWRAANTMWVGIYGGNGSLRKKSKNMRCDGKYKTVIWRPTRYARTAKSYVRVFVNGERTLVQVAAYAYW